MRARQPIFSGTFKEMYKPLFHLMAFSINSFVLLYDQFYIDIPLPCKKMEDLPLRSRSMFLTVWCLVLQTIYYFMAFLNDIADRSTTAKRPTALRKALDRLFSLAFPLALYISIAFWSIYIKDKEAIFPEYVEKLYPPIFNHVMHSTVSVFMFIELFMSRRDYPPRRTGLLFIYSFLITYAVWFFYIYAITGGWPYPFFENITWTSRTVFMIFSLFVVLIIYIATERLNQIVWSKPQLYTNGVNGKSNANGKCS